MDELGGLKGRNVSERFRIQTFTLKLKRKKKKKEKNNVIVIN